MKVERIPTSEALPWILAKHYAHRVPSISYAFGLFDDGVLIGVCTYGQPASPFLCVGVCGPDMSERVIELNRVCCSEGKNQASKIVGRSLGLIKGPKIIVSYADCKEGHIGIIYQATNWVYTGRTKERTDMFSTSGHSRHNNGDPSIRQNRSAKHRYVYFVGSRKQKAEMMQALRYPVMPYPKGESRRYDASASVDIQGVLF